MVVDAALDSADALMASARADERSGSHDRITGASLLESGQKIIMQI